MKYLFSTAISFAPVDNSNASTLTMNVYYVSKKQPIRRGRPLSDRLFSFLQSFIYSIKSPGWHCKTAQILSNAATGMCFAAPVHSAEIVGGRIPVCEASSFCVISRSASITFMRNFIIVSPQKNYTTPFEFYQYAFRKLFLQYSENRIDKLRNS